MKRNGNRKVIASLSMLLQFGLFLLVPICMMSALGYFLDMKFGTKWIAIVFFFIGAIAGFQNIYRYAMNISGSGKTDVSDESEDGSEKGK